jgi:Sec-independent protein translocase protein TatA
MSRMLGLTPSELGIVLFIFLLVVVAAKLPAWGEKLGEFLHGRHGRLVGFHDHLH